MTTPDPWAEEYDAALASIAKPLPPLVSAALAADYYISAHDLHPLSTIVIHDGWDTLPVIRIQLDHEELAELAAKMSDVWVRRPLITGAVHYEASTEHAGHKITLTAVTLNTPAPADVNAAAISALGLS